MEDLETAGACFFAGIFLIVMFFLSSYVVEIFYNILVPHLLHGETITYSTAVLITAFIYILKLII